MNVTHENAGDHLLVSVTGQINSANAAHVESQLLDILSNESGHWILNLAGVDYMSSAGLRVVLLLAKRLREQQKRMVVCGLQARVYEVFDISGFLNLLTVRDNPEQALLSLAG